MVAIDDFGTPRHVAHASRRHNCSTEQSTCSQVAQHAVELHVHRLSGGCL